METTIEVLDGIKYSILGKPIPLQRARHGKGRTYDPQKEDKLIFGLKVKSMRSQDKDQLPPLWEIPLVLWIDFFMPIPKSKKKITDPFYSHYIRPDLSNLIKFVEDVCTGIIYKDDSLITEIHASKHYGDYPRTEFYLTNKGD